MFENSEEYDFTPVPNSNLSSLFVNNDPTEDLDHSLSYTAPKQPRPIPKSLDLSKDSSPKSPSSVICARVITLWKLENNKYNALGLHGIALIGSTKLNSYELILYKKRENVTSRTKVCEGFTLTHQKDFISFYDNTRQNWLIKFNNDEDKASFTNEVEKCGGKNIHSSSQKMKEKESSTPEMLVRSSSLEHKDDSDFSVKNDLNSDSSGSRKRANILTRMAKMGQSMLPQTKTNMKTDVSDTDEEEKESKKDIPKRLKQKNKKPINKLPSTKTSPDNNNLQSISSPNNMNIVQVPHQLNSAASLMQSMAYDPLNLIFAENRTHNSEVRMNLSQISTKLDQVLKIIEPSSNLEIKSNSSNENILKMKLKALELQSENLISEVGKYEEKYLDLQQKLCEQESIAQNAEEKLKVAEDVINKQSEQIHFNELKQKNAVSEAELENYKKIIEELEKLVENQKLKLNGFEQFYEENKDAPTMKKEIKKLNETIADIKLKMKDFEESYQTVECNTQGGEQSEEEKKRCDNFIDILKQTMNKVYNSTMEKFDESKEYSSTEINNIIAKNIKVATFKIIEDFQAVYNINPTKMVDS